MSSGGEINFKFRISHFRLNVPANEVDFDNVRETFRSSFRAHLKFET